MEMDKFKMWFGKVDKEKREAYLEERRKAYEREQEKEKKRFEKRMANRKKRIAKRNAERASKMKDWSKWFLGDELKKVDKTNKPTLWQRIVKKIKQKLD